MASFLFKGNPSNIPLWPLWLILTWHKSTSPYTTGSHSCSYVFLDKLRKGWLLGCCRVVTFRLGVGTQTGSPRTNEVKMKIQETPEGKEHEPCLWNLEIFDMCPLRYPGKKDEGQGRLFPGDWRILALRCLALVVWNMQEIALSSHFHPILRYYLLQKN